MLGRWLSYQENKNTSEIPEEGGAEPPYNVWLYSCLKTICSSEAVSPGIPKSWPPTAL